MSNIQYVPAMRRDRRRWLIVMLTLLLLTLTLGGCGFGGTETDTSNGVTASRVESAIERAEAAAERVEVAAERAEAAAQQVETAAQQSEAAVEQIRTIEVESAPPPSAEATAETAPEETAVEATTEEAGETATAAETETTTVDAPIADGEPIKVGVIATLTGVYAAGGEDGLRGVEMALAEFNSQVNGRPIELIIESSDGAAPDVALNAARKLIEEDNVDIIVGPLSGDEGLVVRDFAKDYPNKTFLNGVSGAQDTTLRDPAPNFFRFSMDGTQWMAGLGRYVYEEKGYRRVATLADDYSFPYSQVGGFVVDFCQAGGDVSETFWVPLGTTDFSGVVSVLPTDIDAIYIGLGGTDSLNFLEQYQEAGGTAPLIASSISLDQSILSVEGDFANYVVGTSSSGPIADNNPDPDWQQFVAKYQEMFPDGFASPSLFAHGYYLNAKAMMLALHEVEGDLSDGQQAFQAALSGISFDSPTGPVRLDENRQAISSNFITEVDRDENGKLYNKFVAEVPNVAQTLGLEREAYLSLGPLSRNNPLCEDIKILVATQGNAVAE